LPTFSSVFPYTHHALRKNVNQAIKDKDIDCSDIPEATASSNFHLWEQRQMFKPVKVVVTCKLDADIVAWLKQGGKGYQTRLNTILRKAMSHA